MFVVKLCSWAAQLHWTRKIERRSCYLLSDQEATRDGPKFPLGNWIHDYCAFFLLYWSTLTICNCVCVCEALGPRQRFHVGLFMHDVSDEIQYRSFQIWNLNNWNLKYPKPRNGWGMGFGIWIARYTAEFNKPHQIQRSMNSAYRWLSQNCSTPSALMLGLLQSCIKPTIQSLWNDWSRHKICTIIRILNFHFGFGEILCCSDIIVATVISDIYNTRGHCKIADFLVQWERPTLCISYRNYV